MQVRLGEGYSAAQNEVTGPKTTSGPERGSLTVQCNYTSGWKTHKKYWCRGAVWRGCKTLVKTTGSEQEVKKDRVSIRDDQENLTFMVTMEDLRRDDADIYWCAIERSGYDLKFPVDVTIDPVSRGALLFGVLWAGPGQGCSHPPPYPPWGRRSPVEPGGTSWQGSGGTKEHHSHLSPGLEPLGRVLVAQWAAGIVSQNPDNAQEEEIGGYERFRIQPFHPGISSKGGHAICRLGARGKAGGWQEEYTNYSVPNYNSPQHLHLHHQHVYSTSRRGKDHLPLDSPCHQCVGTGFRTTEALGPVSHLGGCGPRRGLRRKPSGVHSPLCHPQAPHHRAQDPPPTHLCWADASPDGGLTPGLEDDEAAEERMLGPQLLPNLPNLAGGLTTSSPECVSQA
ncbi:Hypothetical predicted protein [Marmota monax]|uniref:Immunoglobulin domain-containing protein n=1 Tax=Marmota monax TaxID=9995 RepID=A0A5E4CZ38_MARMO|nr:hypothetical protein GHT09_017895 [Marmota monax]VTJ86530.1 Hypothetical predicted protein [Marmota monax]